MTTGDRAVFGLGALLMLYPLTAGAQEAPTFRESVDVRVVSVDVFVTDRKGNRVPGLTRDDFVVLQDGQPVEITNFSRVTGRVRADEPPVAAGTLDAGLEGEPLAPLAEPHTVVVFIDNSTLTPPHRNRVLGDLEAFMIEQMAAGVPFMIAAFNPGLEILMPVGTDPESARAALERVAETPARGMMALAERRRTLSFIQNTYELYEEAGPGAAGSNNPRQAGFKFDPCTAGWEKMLGAVDEYSQAAGARVGDVQAGLVGLTRSLGGVPGRKSLLYLSDGLEQRPGIDLYGFLGELCPRRERDLFSYMTRWDETPLLEELAEYASAHQVTLYALETTGLTSHSAASVELGAKQFTPSARNDALRVSNLQSSLFILAEATGGRAFLNANFPGPELAKVAEDFGDFYSLGFVPPTGWDGAVHTIRVTLVDEEEKGRELRYRLRYRAIPDDERMAERTLATLVLGWEDNPLGTEIRLGDQRRLDGAWEVPVEIVVPADRLGTVRRSDAADRLVRVLMMAEDAKGRRTPMREKLVPLRYAASDRPADEPTRLVVNMELQEGPHTIAVGVRDEINGTASFHKTRVEVGEVAPES